MNNLTTHMSELKRILASIENKNMNEGAVGETGEQFIKRLVGKTGAELVKELGPRVEIATVLKKPKVLNGEPTGEFIEKEFKEVWEHMPGTELYAIKSVNGKVPKQMRPRTADIIKTEVEIAAREGRTIKSTSVNASKSVADPVAPQLLDPASEATAKAEKLSIPELEKRLAGDGATALERKAYADELAKKKVASPSREVPRDKFDSAEVARKKAQGMSREDLEDALKNKDIPAVTRKEYEAELAKRPKSDAPRADTPPKEEPSAPKTGEEVLVKKEIEQAKDTARSALDDGTVKIKDENLLPKKPNETPTEQLERTLKDDPAYKGAWEGLAGTEKEVGFWKRLGRKAKVGGLISIPVLLAAGGAYLAMRDKDAPEEEDLAGQPDAATDGKTDAATDGKTDAATDGKTDAATDGKTNQAGKVTEPGQPGVANKPTPDQDIELAKLKAQIDALIAELAKSKDPAIQKRLDAVRSKLGMANQAASVTSTEKGGWKNIGNNYRRWYGPDGYDEEGNFVKRGDLDTIPYDAGQADEYSKMTHQELLRRARLAGKPIKP